MASGGCRAFWGLSSVKSLCSNPRWDKHYPQVPSDGLLNTSLAAAGSLGTSPCSWGGMGDPTPKEQRCDFTFLLLCLKGQPGSFGGFLPSFHFFFPDLGSWVLPRRIFFFYFWSKMGKFLGIKSSSAVAHKGPHTAYALSSNQVTWSNCRNVTDIVCLAFNSLKMFKHKKRLRTFTVIFEIRMCEK